MSEFLLGWGEADTTPLSLENVSLNGQYYERMAVGIHSRLSCTAFLMQKGDQQSIMVSLDTVGQAIELQAYVREEVAKKNPEIKKEAIFLNAIHTHSAPRPIFANGKGNDYFYFIAEKIVEAILQAWNNRQPGAVQFAFANARIGHCRRAVYSNGTAEMYGDTHRDDFIGMEAGEDSGVEIMYTFDAQKNPTGVVVNVACPSQVMEATYLISSDYMGATRRLMKQQFGENFHTLCQISAAGCQSPRDLTRNGLTEPDFWHEDGVVEISNRLFYALMHPTFKREPEENPVFETDYQTLELPLRRVSYTDYVKATAELERLEAILPEDKAFEAFCAETHANEKIPGRPGPYDSKLHHFVLIKNARAVLNRYERQKKENTISYPMYVVRVGDCAFVNVCFELYLVYGQMIKARSKARQTFIVQLSPSSFGYLPSTDAEKFGGYGGLVVNGFCGSDAGFKLVDDVVATIKKLF